MYKKALTFTSMLILFLTMLIVQVYGFSGEGRGTESRPYIITTEYQLREIDDSLSAYYRLGNDIDLKNNLFRPLAIPYYDKYSGPFKGILDGNGYKIKNLKIGKMNGIDASAGLFCSLDNATIKNLTIENADIRGENNNSYTGAIAAYMKDGRIENCHVINAYIKSSDSDAGGLVGYLEDGVIKESSCTKTSVDADECGGGLVGRSRHGVIIDSFTSEGSVRGYNGAGGLIGSQYGGSVSRNYSEMSAHGSSSVGGLVGSISGNSSMSWCYATGSAYATKRYAGGLVGSSSIYISSCYATGNVYADGGYVGGLAGSSLSVVSHCFSTGDAYTEAGYVGGFIGVGSGTIQYCYSTGAILHREGTSRTKIAPFVGDSTYAVIKDCYFNRDVNEGFGFNDLSKTEEQLRTVSNYVNWDMKNTWGIYEGISYPYLKSLKSPFPEPLAAPIGYTASSKTYDSLTLKWNAVAGATSYEVKYNGVTRIATGASIMYINLSPGKTYTFQIRAKNDSTLGHWTPLFNATTAYLPLDMPVGLNLVEKTGKSIVLKWATVRDATSYQILCAGKTISSNSTSATISDLEIDTEYSITVKALATNRTSNWSQPLIVSTSSEYLPAPIGLKCDSQTRSALGLSWEPVMGSTQYTVLLNGNTYITSNNNILIDKLEPGSEYSASVKAENSKTQSNYSQVINVTTLEGAVYRIKTVEDLDKIRNDLQAEYFLENDIDLKGMDWQPIGDELNPFKGTFYGQGNIVKNLKINVKADAVGFFAYTEEAMIYGLHFVNVNIHGETIAYTNNDVGTLVGQMKGGVIDSCFVESESIIDGDFNIGGLVGKTLDGSKITNSGANIDVSSTGNGTISAVGGLIGSNAGEIINCYSTGKVSAQKEHIAGFSYMGGLIGRHNSEKTELIDNCYSTGNVSGKIAGGLIGEADFAKLSLIQCYTTGDVNGSHIAGGLLGWIESQKAAELSVSQCYSTGNVQGESAGGLLGHVTLTKLNLSQCYSAGEKKAGKIAGGLAGYLDGSTIEIKDCFVTGNIRAINENNNKVYLGGILGDARGDIKVINCYFSGTTGNSLFGGIYGSGYKDSGTSVVVESSYFDSQKAGISIPKEEARTAIEMKTKAIFIGWEFDTIWRINEKTSYPYLICFDIVPGDGEIDIKANEEIIIALTAVGINAPINEIFTLTYDSSQLTIIDFAAQTKPLDISTGLIKDTDLSIISFKDGEVTFKLNKTTLQGQTWSGVLSAVKFKAKVTGKTDIELK